MIDREFKIILTNGSIENEYKVRAFNREQAIILAQAEAIKQGKGYKLVKVIGECNHEWKLIYENHIKTESLCTRCGDIFVQLVGR